MTSRPAALAASKSRLRVKSWLQGEGLGLGLMVKGTHFVCEGPHNYTSIKCVSVCVCVCVCVWYDVPFYSSALKFSAKSSHFSAAPTHTDTHKHTRTDVANALIHQADQKTRTHSHMWADTRTKHIHHAARKCTQRYTTESVCMCVCVCVSNKQAYK